LIHQFSQTQIQYGCIKFKVIFKKPIYLVRRNNKKQLQSNVSNSNANKDKLLNGSMHDVTRRSKLWCQFEV